MDDRIAAQQAEWQASAQPVTGQEALRRGAPAVALAVVSGVALVAAVGVIVYLLGRGGPVAGGGPAPGPASPSASQPTPTPTVPPWAVVYGSSLGDGFNSVALAPDGSVIAVGDTGSSEPSGGDALVVKIRPDGSLAWAKTYGGSHVDLFNAVAIAPDGGIIAAGWTMSADGDFPGSGGQNAVVARIDPDGSLAWARTSGGSGDGFTSVAVASDGSIIAAGNTQSAGGDFPVAKGDQDAVLAKINPDGSLAWARAYGGSGADQFDSVTVGPDGGIVAAGYTGSTNGDFPITEGVNDGVVARIDPDGSLAWGKAYGGLDWGKDYGDRGVDYFNSVAVAPDGSVVVGGLSMLLDEASKTDAVMIRLSADGGLVWGKTYSGSDVSGFYSVAVASDGNILAAGGSDGGDALVAKIDTDGSLAWARTYGGSGGDGFSSIAVAPDGGIIAAGTTNSPDGDFPDTHDADSEYLYSDAVVARLTADGSLT